MESNTRQRILDTALEMFSKNGYYGTSMSDIADELGITKTALYRHFCGKEDIFNAVLDAGESYYERNFGSRSHPPKIPESMDELRQLSLSQINFTMHDTDVIRFRRLFTIEQFRSDRMAELATNHFISRIEEMYSYIFEHMMDRGMIRQCDTELLAYEYVAPITIMIHMCDRQPEMEDEAMQRICRHIDNFINIFAVAD